MTTVPQHQRRTDRWTDDLRRKNRTSLTDIGIGSHLNEEKEHVITNLTQLWLLLTVCSLSTSLQTKNDLPTPL